MEAVVEVLGIVTLTFFSIKLLSLFRACCIMWVGKCLDFTKYGRWAVVTGCTDGIGKAYAQELARLGMDIVLISRSPYKLQNTAAQIESKYKSKTKIIDIDFTAGNEIYDRLRKELEGHDVGVLVNNVGMSISHPEYFLQVENSEKVYRDLIECNMSSVTFMTNLILPKMVEKKKGVVINISSLSAACPCPLLSTYAASKAYVDSLSHALCDEYKDSGIIIQTVLPGFVATKLSNIKKTSLSVPNPTTFARSALRTVGKLDRTAGFWFHEYQLRAIDVIAGTYRGVVMYLGNKILHPIRKRALRRKKQE